MRQFYNLIKNSLFNKTYKFQKALHSYGMNVYKSFIHSYIANSLLNVKVIMCMKISIIIQYVIMNVRTKNLGHNLLGPHLISYRSFWMLY